MCRQLLFALKYTWRIVRGHAAESLLQIIMLSLGLGPLIAATRLSEYALTSRLPYAEPGRLVLLTSSVDSSAGSLSVTFGDFFEAEKAGHIFESVAAVQHSRTIRGEQFNFDDSGVLYRLSGARVSPGFFDVMGTPPMKGRTFHAGDNGADSDAVVISARLWRRLGGTVSVIGRSMSLGGRSYVVIGVMPPDFKVDRGDVDDAWIIHEPTTADIVGLRQVCCEVVARLRKGISVEAANAELFRGATTFGRTVAVPVRDQLLGNTKETLELISGAALVLFLLIGTATTYLQVVRGLSYSRTFVMMRALGASTLWVAMTRAMPGILIGLAAAVLSTALYPTLLELTRMLILTDFGTPTFVSTRVLIVIVAGPLVLAAISAWLAMRLTSGVELASAGREDRTPTLVQRDITMWRRRGTVLATAAATCLLVLCGLITATLARVNSTTLGFDPTQVTIAEVRLWAPKYNSSPVTWRFADELASKLRALPGASDVSVASGVPILAPGTTRVLHEGSRREVNEVRVDANYFSFMHIPVLRGRVFEAEGAEAAVVVSASAATALFGRADPIGQHLTLSNHVTVIGVVADVIHRVESTNVPTLYVAAKEQPGSILWFLVRSAKGVSISERMIRNAVAELDPGQPVERVESLQDVTRTALRAHAAVALVVAVLTCLGWGITLMAGYGALVHAMAQRRTEIGVRLALGGSPHVVGRQILWTELRPVLAGLALGLVASIPASRLVAHLIVGLRASDRGTVAIGCVVLITIAVWVCSGPARRVVRTSPQELLRGA